MSDEEARRNDKVLHNTIVKKMLSANIPISDADMAVSVAIEVIRQVEGKIMGDIKARVGHSPKIAALALTTVTELLPSLADAMAESIMERLMPKNKGAVEQLVEGLINILSAGPEDLEQMFRAEMISKAEGMGFKAKGDKNAIVIVGCNPTEKNCNCSACILLQLIDKEPSILPEDQLMVEPTMGVRAIRMGPDVLRKLHRDAELLAQKAGAA
jgi:hypothetical protein